MKSAVALHFAHYNFIRIHRSLRYTPAMAAGITDHIWKWEDYKEKLYKVEELGQLVVEIRQFLTKVLRNDTNKA